MRFDPGKEGVEFRDQGGEETGLGCRQVGRGKEFEVLAEREVSIELEGMEDGYLEEDNRG